MSWTSNLVAPITPAGRGAIATVAAVGPDVLASVARRFTPAAGKPLTSFAVGRIVLGRFRGLETEEELVVGLVAHDHLEVHCHGGSAAVEAVIAALVAEGCQPITWQEFAQLLEDDSLATEARIALAAATTERTATILLEQYQGALGRAIRLVQADLERGNVAQAQEQLAALLGRSSLGKHLTQPWKVVLAGRPNVGKSSLINALVGYSRSIVFDQPGTTRDILTATTAIDGWPIDLSDTAGLRAARDAIEHAGIERSRTELAATDLVLLVFEAAVTWSAHSVSGIRSRSERTTDEALLAELPADKPRLVIYNKCDLGLPLADGRPSGLAVSAIRGTGLDALLAAIALTLVPEPPEPGVAVPFTQRQIAALSRAAQLLTSGKAVEAGRQLAALFTGGL